MFADRRIWLVFGVILLVGVVYSIVSQRSAGILLQLAFIALAVLVAIDVHEFGHAVVADRLGDDGPRRDGRVTLNPIKHLDPLGTIMILMTFASGFGIGWGRPVMVRPAKLANGRTGMAIVAVAGAAANLITAVLAGVVLHVLGAMGTPSLTTDLVLQLLLTIGAMNVLFAVFNILIPLPPLDGYNFLANILPLHLAWQYRKLEQFGPLLLLLVVIGSQLHLIPIDVLGILVGRPSQWLSHIFGLG